jgi:hypothetical protein
MKSASGRAGLFGPSLFGKLPKNSFPVRYVHCLQFFELIQEGSRLLGVVAATSFAMTLR